MTEAKRAGIFGGTFNPIHLGHLRSAEEVTEALDLATLWFVPSGQPPHKSATDRDPIAPASDRLAWVRAATRDNPRFDVDPLETERAGSSFTVDTLEAFGARTSPELPVLVIGHDAFIEMDSWREPGRIFELAHVAVTTRPPAAIGALADWLPKRVRDDIDVAADGRSGRHRRAGSTVRVVEISALEISSSDIRRRLREGRSIRYLVPNGVERAIRESGAYA